VDHPQETSSGGVIYRRGEAGIEVCIIAVAGGERWQLPKGHVDPGESLEETAGREVAEETGLTGRQIGKIDGIDYWFWNTHGHKKERVHKNVHFFLFEYESGSTENHDYEVDDAAWFPIEEAMEKLTFDSEKGILKKAAAMIVPGGGEGDRYGPA